MANKLWGNVNVGKSKNKNLSWAQAKAKYPRMKATADTDNDGVMNYFDCRPLNKEKKGELHDDDVSYRDMNPEDNFNYMRTTNDKEQKLIKEVLERARLKKKGIKTF